MGSCCQGVKFNISNEGRELQRKLFYFQIEIQNLTKLSNQHSYQSNVVNFGLEKNEQIFNAQSSINKEQYVGIGRQESVVSEKLNLIQDQSQAIKDNDGTRDKNLSLINNQFQVIEDQNSIIEPINCDSQQMPQQQNYSGSIKSDGDNIRELIKSQREQRRKQVENQRIQSNVRQNKTLTISPGLDNVVVSTSQQQNQEVDLKASKRSMKIGKEIFVNLKTGSIENNYVMSSVLGQGAFGKVWKVRHRTTGLIRAMKQINKNALINEEREKLFSELNILRNLDHPHVVKLFELFQDDKNYYLITEYLSGGELFDRIKKMTHFSERRAADLMRQILLAVLYCHEQQIVHRDLKPENIIFVSESPDSTVKIIDFGTSRKFTGKIMTKKLGTPYYIAPEVINQNYNEKCDIWSCGVILYILLCGYPPFCGKSEKDIMQKVKAGKFEFLQEDWYLISNEVKQLIQKMLTLDPNKRVSAKDILSDPWITKHAPNQPINKRAINNLINFSAQTMFKQALLSYIVSQMSSHQEIQELQKTFLGLDKNNDGFLSKDELIEGYMVVYGDRDKAIEWVDKTLELIDINQSGKVDFSEFLMAAMNKEKLISIKRIEQAFQLFDTDGDGYISKQEIKTIMGDLDDDIWKQFLIEVDINNDGKISMDEFRYVLMCKVK